MWHSSIRPIMLHMDAKHYQLLRGQINMTSKLFQLWGCLFAISTLHILFILAITKSHSSLWFLYMGITQARRWWIIFLSQICLLSPISRISCHYHNIKGVEACECREEIHNPRLTLKKHTSKSFYNFTWKFHPPSPKEEH